MPGAYTLVARRRASWSIAEPGGTCAATSAMCTHMRTAGWSGSDSILSAETASSKSRAVAGSTVKVGRSRRSRLRPSCSSVSALCHARAPAARASRSTGGSKRRAKPASRSICSIASRAVSVRSCGGHTTRALEDFAIRGRPAREPAPLPREALDFGARPLVGFAFLTAPLLFPSLPLVFASLPFVFFPSLPPIFPSPFSTAPLRGRLPRAGLI